MKNLSNQQTVILVAFLACVTLLAFTGRETGALIAVGVAILGGLGLAIGQQQGIKDNTNGTNQRLLEVIDRAAAESTLNSRRLLSILEGNQRELSNLAHLMATMTPPLSIEPPPVQVSPAAWTPDQEKRAA